MMTYNEYLEDYVLEMCDSKEIDIPVLCKEVDNHNYRLRGPLVVYLIESNQVEKVPTDSCIYSICLEIKRYVDNKEPLPREYMKVERSYQSYLLREQDK